MRATRVDCRSTGGEQRLWIDRQPAGAELDSDLERDAVARGASDSIARGDRRAYGHRDGAELGEHDDVGPAVDDRALIEAADRPGVAHGACGGRDDRAAVLDLDVDPAPRQRGLRALVLERAERARDLAARGPHQLAGQRERRELARLAGDPIAR